MSETALSETVEALEGKYTLEDLFEDNPSLRSSCYLDVDLLDDGILWFVNRTCFHPLGFALTYMPEEHRFTLLGDGSVPLVLPESLEGNRAQMLANVFEALRLGLPDSPVLDSGPEDPSEPSEGVSVDSGGVSGASDV